MSTWWVLLAPAEVPGYAWSGRSGGACGRRAAPLLDTDDRAEGFPMERTTVDTRELVLPKPRTEVIGGRGPGWPVGTPLEDEEYEPTIVRGRE
ncbi:hypothetical protein GCM10010483_31830 [Actinokineospora diospyrosa]